MATWLVKTEPSTYSIDDFAREKITYWDGVRNYQARNFLREMKKGEKVLVYHSNAKPPSIVGLAIVDSDAEPDPTQFDKKSKYFDPKATAEEPRWFCPKLRFEKKFSSPLGLDQLREESSLEGMVLLQRGSRLSVQPVKAKEFQRITKLAQKGC